MPKLLEDMKMDDLTLLNNLALQICRIISPSQEVNRENLESLLAASVLSTKLFKIMELEGVQPKEMVMAAGALIGPLATKAAEIKRLNQRERN